MSNSCPVLDPAWIANDEKLADNTCNETLSRDKFSGEAEHSNRSCYAKFTIVLIVL